MATTTKVIESKYKAHATEIFRLGDHVRTPAIGLKVGIPGVVVSASDHAAPVIAYPHLGQISAYSAAGVELVRRGTAADVISALRACAAKLAGE